MLRLTNGVNVTPVSAEIDLSLTGDIVYAAPPPLWRSW